MPLAAFLLGLERSGGRDPRAPLFSRGDPRCRAKRRCYTAPRVPFAPVLLGAFLLGGHQADVAAWNRFRGPNGTGIAAGGSYLAEIGPAEHVLWKCALPPGRSSPVLSRARVFLTALEGEELLTLAVERTSGAIAWKRPAPRPRRTRFHPDNHPAAPSAAVDADTVVVFFDEFGLLAYDHDGEERWRLALGPFDNVYGLGASPILVGDVVILACDQSTNSFVAGFSKRDGKELWRTPRPSAVSGHCTPVLWRAADGRDEVLLPGSYLLDAYDALTGARRWWVSGLPAEMKSVPVLLGDRLYLHGYNSPLNELGSQVELAPFAEALKKSDANADGRIAAAEIPDERVRGYFEYYDLVPDGALDATEWEALRVSLAALNSAQCIRPGGQGDVSATNVLWRFHRGIPQLPSPLVYGGVYWMLADQGGLVTQLDPATGEMFEKDRLTHALDAYYAAPVAGDGKVYLVSQTGTLSVLAAEKGLELLHSARFDEPCYATPALEDGRIYLRTERQLYCFGAP
jgi:outer membrane protein assembly factor BamB